MVKSIEMNELQLYIYYQFIQLIDKPNELVLVEFTIKSHEYLNTLFQINLLLGTTLQINGNKATVEIDSKVLKKLIVLAGKQPGLISKL